MDSERLRDVLQQENRLLRERIAELERALFETPWPAPIEWRLTVQEARIFGVLVNRDLASKEAMMTALYSDRPDDAPEVKIVDVFVCKLRKKVRPFGVEIRTVWGRGWSLAAETRASFRKAAA